MKRPTIAFRAVVALLFACGIAFAEAQSFNRPMRIIVPTPPGTTMDTLARVLGQAVSPVIGQPVLVENKTGADGAIAGAEVVKAAPDGHTLLLGSPGPIVSVVALRKTPPYDPTIDLTPVIDVGRFTTFLYIHPDVPAKNFQELIAYAKANPGKLAYGTGTTTALASFAQIRASAGIDMLHVPYKGEPAGLIDLISGRIQLMLATAANGLPHVQRGALKALVTLGTQRSPLAPDVPTIHEAGLTGFRITSFTALYGPARMAPELTAHLNKLFLDAMKRPEVAAQFVKAAVEMTPSTPSELVSFTKQQVSDYTQILRAAGVQPD